MDFSAHAYLIRGGKGTAEKLLQILQKSGIETTGNADLLVRTYSSFTMEDARSLRERATLKGVDARGRIFVITAPTIPPDAQNALLKTFEEPVAGAKFFLIVASPETLLPTLRSRMQILEIAGEPRESPVDVQMYLRSSPEKRVELLKPLLEKGDDDKRDLSGTIEFLSGLEYSISKSPQNNAKGLHAIYRARRYITDRGALAKTLLEQTAFIIPKVL